MIQLLLASVLNGLVVFTLAYMLVELDGPFEIFFRIREWAGVEYDAEGATVYNPKKFFGSLLGCFWCTSTWVSAAVSVATVLILGSVWYTWFYIWLASIAIAGMWYNIIETRVIARVA